MGPRLRRAKEGIDDWDNAATEQDFERIWPIFHEIVAAGETYAYGRNTTKEQALSIWIEVPRKTFVAEEAGNTLGTYYIKTNQQGPEITSVIVRR